MFKWYFSQSKSSTPISRLPKVPPLQSGNDSTLFPLKDPGSSLGAESERLEEAGPHTQTRPELDILWEGRCRNVLLKSSGLRTVYQILGKPHVFPQFSLPLSLFIKISGLE